MTPFLTKLNRVPPYLCRLWARHQGRPVSNVALAHASGLDRHTIGKISRARTWNNIRVKDMAAFAEACGVNPLHPRRHLDFFKRKKKVHIRRSPYYLSLLKHPR